MSIHNAGPGKPGWIAAPVVRREYVAMVTHRSGTQAVTIHAVSVADARQRLMQLGYTAVLSVGPIDETAIDN